MAIIKSINMKERLYQKNKNKKNLKVEDPLGFVLKEALDKSQDSN